MEPISTAATTLRNNGSSIAQTIRDEGASIKTTPNINCRTRCVCFMLSINRKSSPVGHRSCATVHRYICSLPFLASLSAGDFLENSSS
jgi:hypothetical protein